MPRILFALLLLTLQAAAEPATPLTSLARMPVREITVFKDGHAFVLHSARMPVDGEGNVMIDALPDPVLGTFWPFSADKSARLNSVVATVRKIKLDRTALNLRELIEANIGASVSVTELPIRAAGDREAQPITYTATIDSIPSQTGEELEATSPPDSGEKLPAKGNVVLFKTNSGIKTVDFNRIVDVTFVKPPHTALGREEFRNLMTLKLDWNGKPAEKQAEVGMLYLQKGIRWIPNYKVMIDGKGNAVLQLQATLINELTDLDNVTCNLVVGVPSFAFAGMKDPIALQKIGAQLSQYFETSHDTLSNQTAAFSNAIMTQTPSRANVVRAAPAEAPADLGPDVTSQGKAEDLYLFTLSKVTLKKGQRMVLPVAQYTISYKDIYSLNVPVTPPPDVYRAFNDSRKAEMIRQLASPKVVHKIRLFNNSGAPFTTAPAIIVQNEKLDPKNPATLGAPGSRLIAQSLMTFTAPGGATDLELTTTVEVLVKKTDTETGRIPKALQWNDHDYLRIDLAGKITLTSYARQPIEVEVIRHILGNPGSADAKGKTEAVNFLEDSGYTSSGYAASLPPWHTWYNWPEWWTRFNGVGRITWNLTLEPGKPAEVNYTWHYFWR